jgi:hypothetical protein
VTRIAVAIVSDPVRLLDVSMIEEMEEHYVHLNENLGFCFLLG